MVAEMQYWEENGWNGMGWDGGEGEGCSGRLGVRDAVDVEGAGEARSNASRY